MNNNSKEEIFGLWVRVIQSMASGIQDISVVEGMAEENAHHIAIGKQR